MQINVTTGGRTYECTPTNDEISLESMADAFFDNISAITKCQLTLKGGGFLVLGQDALKSAAFEFLP